MFGVKKTFCFDARFWDSHRFLVLLKMEIWYGEERLKQEEEPGDKECFWSRLEEVGLDYYRLIYRVYGEEVQTGKSKYRTKIPVDFPDLPEEPKQIVKEIVKLFEEKEWNEK